MRVAHVITRLIVGGAQENTIASVLGLASRPGIEVSLVSGPTSGPEGSLQGAFVEKPGMLTIIPPLVRPVHPWKDLLAYRQLIRHFRLVRPDIVHTHSGKAGILGRLAASKAGIPIIVHSIHGPSFGAFQGLLPNLLFRAAERYAGRVTTHFVCVADAMKQQYLAAGIGKPEMYSRVFSGFLLDPFLSSTNNLQLRAKLGLLPEHVVVGKIARLFRLKGHEDLFDIAPALVRQCPNLRFLLVGDGEWRGRFEARTRGLGLEKHFIFTGLVQPSEIPALVGIMDFLVHLSRREGLPRALPQALAAARPVIAYDCDGAKEVCRNGETGFLVPIGDIANLSSRIVQLAQDPALRERLGCAGRQLVRKSFSLETMVDALQELYLRLTQQLTPRESNRAAVS
jgi:glycosyltransferase involved in cell wall biosynthesis